MKYYANFNNGAHYMQYPIVSNNKKKLLKDIRDIAIGNQYENKLVIWRVWDENKETVYEAMKRKKTTIIVNNYRWISRRG